MTRFGVTFFPTDQSIGPAELARAVEERNLDALFFPEHSHIPVAQRTPFPGGPLPEHYRRSLDPFVALAAAAVVTDRITLGTSVCLVVQRDPIHLAKEAASVDLLSGGRLELGIGAGWNREEMANHGASFKLRWQLVREKVLAMKAIWTMDEAEFHGEHVDFDPIWAWPKPSRPGGPPILMGASSRWSFDRIAEYCDGWMPIGTGGPDNLQRLRDAMDRAGRSMSSLTLCLVGTPEDPAEVADRIAQGFTELMFMLPQGKADVVLPALDRLANLVSKFR